jgi:hypothetical protein
VSSAIFLVYDDSLTQTLGRATGKEQGIPPWTSIVQQPSIYFDADQVPEGFTLLDPSKMKDPQIQELLNYWYERQQDEETGIGFKFQEDPNVKTRKRTHEESDSDSDPEANSPGNKQPPKKRARQGKGTADPPQKSKPTPTTKAKGKGKAAPQPTGKPKAKSQPKGKAKGKGKATEKATPKGKGSSLEAGNRRDKESWLEHIQPDSRRRTQGAAEVDSDSGESFDFREVNNMPDTDSDDDGNNPGPSSKPAKVGFGHSAPSELLSSMVSMSYIASIGENTVIRRSTRGPKSKQNDLQMISVTSHLGQISIQPVVPREPTTEGNGAPVAPGVTDRQNQPTRHAVKRDINRQVCFVDVPSCPNNGPQVVKRATRSNTAAIAQLIPLPVGKESVSAVFQKDRKGDKRKA